MIDRLTPDIAPEDVAALFFSDSAEPPGSIS
jgi:hypothetical protein